MNVDLWHIPAGFLLSPFVASALNCEEDGMCLEAIQRRESLTTSTSIFKLEVDSIICSILI